MEERKCTGELSLEELAQLLYERGFLEQALERYEALARRYPAREDLQRRVDELRLRLRQREMLEGTRPIPPEQVAELLVRQGFHGRALGILESLARHRPADEKLQRRIDCLREQIGQHEGQAPEQVTEQLVTQEMERPPARKTRTVVPQTEEPPPPAPRRSSPSTRDRR